MLGRRRQAITSYHAMARYLLHGTQQLQHGTGASAVWPAANRAIYIPVELDLPMLVAKMFVYNGATVNGNLDIGIYTADGTRLVSSGSTAQAGTTTLQEFDLTDTELARGLYYMALALSSGTATVQRFNAGAANDYLLWGALQEASALPLPATATFAQNQTAYLPWFGMSGRTLL